MKQRIFCLIAMMLILLGACESASLNRTEEPFLLYYTDENGGIITKTIFLQESMMSVKQIVNAYMKAEPPEGARRAIPAEWILQSAEMEEMTAVIVFEGNESSQIERSLAAACLVKTLTQIDGVQAVRMLAPGSDEAIVLSPDNILLEDTSMLPQKESITLYLADGQHRYLTRQTQTVEAMEASDKPKYIMERLLDTSNTACCIPAGTRLLGISVENGICTVNLSSEFVRNMKAVFSEERLAVYSIVNSLMEMPEVTTVDLWIEGAPLEKLNFMQLPNGLERNESLVLSASPDIMDATLYVTHDGTSLIAVPMQVQLNEEASYEELLIGELIRFQSESGANPCIPAGTKLLSIRMEGSACIIDLTGEFLPQGRSELQEQLAVRSMIATMCAVDGITSAEILVEGLEPVYLNSALKDMRQPEAHWYAEH